MKLTSKTKVHCSACGTLNADLTILMHYAFDGAALVVKNDVCQGCGLRTPSEEVEALIRERAS